MAGLALIGQGKLVNHCGQYIVKSAGADGLASFFGYDANLDAILESSTCPPFPATPGYSSISLASENNTSLNSYK